MKVIDSPQNATIKKVVNYLEKSRERKKDGVFVVEGIRENARAIEKGYVPTWLFFDKELLKDNQVQDLLALENSDVWYHGCSQQVFSKIAFRSTVANVVGVYKQKDCSLKNIKLAKGDLVLVVQAVEKPGNLGAMLRTANAAGVSAVLVADAVLDLHHPQAIRNSLGGFFDLQIALGSSDEIIELLKAHEFQIVVTYLEGAIPHSKADYSASTAIVMGAEDKGVTQEWIDAADIRVKIPMQGVVDSLNVSAAAAIMLFEANRQRGLE